jgi:Sec-independent protein translocase protein TatA
LLAKYSAGLCTGFSLATELMLMMLPPVSAEKLPRVVSAVGRWVGRARGMARQFREQLEEEVQLEQVRKAQRTAPPQPGEPVAAAAEALAASAKYGMAQPEGRSRSMLLISVQVESTARGRLQRTPQGGSQALCHWRLH